MPTGTRPKPTPLDYAVAARVRTAMAGRTPAMLQRQLEEASGIPQSTLSRLLQPEKGMTLSQLEAICNALGLDMGDLLAGAKADALEASASAGVSGPESPAPEGTPGAPSRVHGQPLRRRGGRTR